jgi:hypothetical protein
VRYNHVGFVPVFRDYGANGHLYPQCWRIRCSHNHALTWNYHDHKLFGDLGFQRKQQCVFAIQALAIMGVRCDADMEQISDFDIHSLLSPFGDWQ